MHKGKKKGRGIAAPALVLLTAAKGSRLDLLGSGGSYSGLCPDSGLPLGESEPAQGGQPRYSPTQADV